MTTRTKVLALAVLAVAAIGTTVGIVAAKGGDGDGRVNEALPILREFDELGNPLPPDLQDVVGESTLVRTEDGLEMTGTIGGLTPGGVYTFWLVAIQGEALASAFQMGEGYIVGDDGRAESTLRAAVGDPGIEGFYVEGQGEIEFADLTDPMTAEVHLEVAYHGQIEDAGDELDAWMSDFWTGTAGVCPSPRGTLGTGAIPSQPYCPVYFLAKSPARG